MCYYFWYLSLPLIIFGIVLTVCSAVHLFRRDLLTVPERDLFFHWIFVVVLSIFKLQAKAVAAMDLARVVISIFMCNKPTYAYFASVPFPYLVYFSELSDSFNLHGIIYLVVIFLVKTNFSVHIWSFSLDFYPIWSFLKLNIRNISCSVKVEW